MPPLVAIASTSPMANAASAMAVAMAKHQGFVAWAPNPIMPPMYCAGTL